MAKIMSIRLLRTACLSMGAFSFLVPALCGAYTNSSPGEVDRPELFRRTKVLHSYHSSIAVPLAQLFEKFADDGDFSVVVAPMVRYKSTIDLQDVTPEEAMARTAGMFELEIRISPESLETPVYLISPPGYFTSTEREASASHRSERKKFPQEAVLGQPCTR